MVALFDIMEEQYISNCQVKPQMLSESLVTFGGSRSTIKGQNQSRSRAVYGLLGHTAQSLET